jgi:exopolysaccharide/PEP-CTERM locus tyrosine autokinase
MSVVERGIRKLQGSAPDKRDSRSATPIAKTVEDTTLADTVVADTTVSGSAPAARTGSFDGAASGRKISFDLTALAAAGLLAPGNERLADEYRAIKQPILRRAAESLKGDTTIDRLVMVASALPGEGKTFTSVNLSLSLAQEKDWSVLLIDTDCRNPSLSQLLGVADQPGLLDYLRSPTASLESFVLPTNFDGLCILPAGTGDAHAAELLASSRMQSICADLATGKFGRFIVVFDSSPLLLTPEAAIIGALVGQIAVVVRADRTVRPAVADALAKLDPSKAIGLVLNGATSADVLSGYANGYGGYGGYGAYRRAE